MKTPDELDAGCQDCGRPYGEEHGFVDMILRQHDWNAISPSGDEGGLLCPCCIIVRLHKIGRRAQVALAGVTIDCIDMDRMHLVRRLENIEAGLEGRMNRWGCALRDRIDGRDPADRSWDANVRGKLP